MRQLAVIREPHFAIEDHTGQSALVFETNTSEGSGASQWITDWLVVQEIFTATKAQSAKDLDGKVCWVETDGNICKFLKIAKL